MKLILGIALLVLALDIGILFLLADNLLRYQHHRYPDAWEQDGRQPGFFWKPPQARWSLTRGSSLASWFKRTPEWAKADQLALERLRWIRWLGWVWIIGLPLLVAVALLAA